jgi:hypothetical protein
MIKREQPVRHAQNNRAVTQAYIDLATCTYYQHVQTVLVPYNVTYFKQYSESTNIASTTQHSVSDNITCIAQNSDPHNITCTIHVYI